MPVRSGLVAIPAAGSAVPWERAIEVFLSRDLAPGTRRVYALTLSAAASHLDTSALAEVSGASLGRAVGLAYPAASPATWNTTSHLQVPPGPAGLGPKTGLRATPARRAV